MNKDCDKCKHIKQNSSIDETPIKSDNTFPDKNHHEYWDEIFT